MVNCSARSCRSSYRYFTMQWKVILTARFFHRSFIRPHDCFRNTGSFHSCRTLVACAPWSLLCCIIANYRLSSWWSWRWARSLFTGISSINYNISSCFIIVLSGREMIYNSCRFRMIFDSYSPAEWKTATFGITTWRGILPVTTLLLLNCSTGSSIRRSWRWTRWRDLTWCRWSRAPTGWSARCWRIGATSSVDDNFMGSFIIRSSWSEECNYTRILLGSFDLNSLSPTEFSRRRWWAWWGSW